jgi:RNA polymerase sigma factor (sigma-70 family)
MTTVIDHLRRTVLGPGAGASTDGDLLGGFIETRNEDAFAALLRRHGPMVWGVCRRLLLHDHDAEDAFQATFIVLVRKAASIRPREAVGNWLHGVAYHVALKARALAMKRRLKEQQVQVMPEPTATPPDQTERIDCLLDQELARLPDKYRLPIVLCDLEGRARKDVAHQLRLKAGTLSSRLTTARRMLAKRLARHGLVLSAATLVTSGSVGAVPPALAQATLRAALGCAAGSASAAAAVSTNAHTLAEGVIRAMFRARLKMAGTLMLATLVLGIGSAVLTHGSPPARRPEAPRKDAPPALRNHALTDRFGDPLPEGALTRLGTTRFRLGNGIYSMALAPDGKTAVSVGGNASTQFWNVASGREICHIEWKDGGGGRVVAYSPNNRWVATVQDQGKLHVWESTTGKHLVQLHLGMDACFSLGFSPDSTMLAAGGSSNKYGRSEETFTDSVISLWRWDGKRLQLLWQAKPDHEAPIKGLGLHGIQALAFSPDGKHLATGGRKTHIIRLWNVQDGKEIRRTSASGNHVGALAFSQSGKVLASGCNDGTVAFWDAATLTRRGHTNQPGEVRSLAFSPNGHIVAAGGGPEYGWNKGPKNRPFLHLLDAADGKVLRRLANIREGVAALAISRDGRILAAGLGGVLRFWDPATGKELGAGAGHDNWISQLDVSADGRLAITAGGDGPLILWDLATGAEKLRLPGHEAEARAVQLVPGRNWAASAGTDQKVYVWDLATGQPVHQFTTNSKRMSYSVAVSPDGKVLASGDFSDGTIHFWDLTQGKLLHQVKIGDQSGEGVNALAFSPSGQVLAVAESALNKARLARETAEPHARIQLWEVRTGRKLREFAAHRYCVSSLAFAPDGTVLASTGWSDKSISLWDAESGTKLFAVPCESGNGVVRVSPDGRMLAWGDSWGKIRLWEMASKKLRRKFQGHTGAICSLAFSPDGQTLLSGSADTTALVWDVTGRGRKGRPSKPLSEQERQSLWQALAAANAEEAAWAVWSLAADPQGTVPFLVDRLRGLSIPVFQRITRLIPDLDSPNFRTRRAAERTLAGFGNLAAPALRAALARALSVESRRRLELLLENRHKPLQAPQALQALRAIEVLEHVGTRAARQALNHLAGQTAEPYIKLEAQTALKRLINH